MDSKDLVNGCVYFFRHIGLSPVKIGYSESESPINRFSQFKTYAPYGSELLGFIPSDSACALESILHEKFKNRRLEGEWFDITEEEVQSEISYRTSAEDARMKNEFQIAYARRLDESSAERGWGSNNKKIQSIKKRDDSVDDIENFILSCGYEAGIFRSNIIRIQASEFYSMYLEYCDKNELPYVSLTSFIRTLKKLRYSVGRNSRGNYVSLKKIDSPSE